MSALVKIGQAAQTLGVSLNTLRRWEEAGKIKVIRTPGGTRLYSLDQLKQLISSHPSASTTYSSMPIKIPSYSPTEHLEKNTAKAEEIINEEKGRQHLYPKPDIWHPAQDVLPPTGQDSANNLKIKKIHFISALALTIPLVILVLGALTVSSNTNLYFLPKTIVPPNSNSSLAILSLPPAKGEVLGEVLQAEVASPNQLLEINADTTITGDLITSSSINGLTLAPTNTGFSISGGNNTATTLTATGSGITLTSAGSTTTLSPGSSGGLNLSSLVLSATSNQLTFTGTSGGTGILTWTPTSSSKTITLPDITTTLVGKTTTDTLSNKTIKSSDSNTISGSFPDITGITSLGTVSTGVWNGTKIAEGYGGTNQSTYTKGDILYASASNTLSKLSLGSNGQYLTISSSLPAWGTLSTITDLAGGASSITGILPLTNGGTGASTASGARTALGLGTIATQDASSIAVTGGTINGTTIGATSASTGAFTTLSSTSGTNLATSTGNVGIGTTAPSSSLHVTGSGAMVAPTSSGVTTLTLRSSTTSPGNILNLTSSDGNTSYLSVSSSGALTVGGSTLTNSGLLASSGAISLTNSDNAIVGTAVEGGWTMNSNTYTFRRIITVTNNDSSTTLPANHEITVTLSGSDASQVYNASQGDYDDVRMAYGSTEIAKNVTTFTSSSVIFTFVTQATIAASSSDATYYLYYRNTSLATAGSTYTSGTVTLDNADTVANWTSSDNTNYPLSQETTSPAPQEGTGSVQIGATTAQSSADLQTWTQSATLNYWADGLAVANIGGTNYFYTTGAKFIQKSTVDANGNPGSFAATSANFDIEVSGKLPIVTTVNGTQYLYYLGGSCGGCEAARTDVHKAVFDGSGNTSFATAGSALPAKRAYLSGGAITISGTTYLYAIGGIDENSTAQSTVYKGTLSNSDGSISSWATTEALPAARKNQTSFIATVNGTNYIYTLGGNAGGAATNTIWKATIGSDGSISGWTATGQSTLPAAMNDPRVVTQTVGGITYVYLMPTVSTTTVTTYKATIDASGNIGAFSTTNQATITTPVNQNGAFTEIVSLTRGGTTYLYAYPNNCCSAGTFFYTTLSTAPTYTATKTLSSTDLSSKGGIQFKFYSSLTGLHTLFEFSEDGSTWQTIPFNVSSANTWETKTLDISSISSTSRDGVTRIRFRTASTSTALTAYFDNIQAIQSSFSGTAPSSSVGNGIYGASHLTLNAQGTGAVRLNYTSASPNAGSGGLELYNGSSTSVFTVSSSGNTTMADNAWLGLGASSGRLEFDDQGTDEVNVLSARVGIGTSTPSYLIDISTSTASERGINISHTATTGTNYGLYTTLSGAATSNTGGYFDVTGATTSRGLQVAALTSATSYGLDIGALSGATANYGINVGAISGTGTAASLTTGAISSTGATAYQLNLGAISGANATSHTGINIGNISGTTAAASGITLGTLTGGTSTNYQISTGALTGIASATNYQINLGATAGAASATFGSINTGALSGAGTASYGINLGANSSTATTNYGINIGAISGAGTTNYGLYLGAVSGASTNYSIYSNGGVNYFAGNVGIGTTAPTAKLEVSGLTLNTDADNTVGGEKLTFSVTKNDTNTRTFAGLSITPTFNTGASNANTTVNILNIDTTNTAVTGLTTNLIKASYGAVQKMLLDSSGNLTLAGNCADAAGGGGCTADYAEVYQKEPDEGRDLEPGDVLMISENGKVKASDSAYTNKIIGVYSESPGLLIGGKNGIQVGVGEGVQGKLAEGEVPVALTGRVKIKVSSENGPIQRGDFLTSSTTSGVAMKATRPGPVVGKALEDFSTSTSGNTSEVCRRRNPTSDVEEEVPCGRVMVFVDTSFADPHDALASLSLDNEGNLLVPQVKSNKLLLTTGSASGIEVTENHGNLVFTQTQKTGGNSSYALDIAATLKTIDQRLAEHEAKLQDLASHAVSLQGQEASNSAALAELQANLASISAQTQSIEYEVLSMKDQEATRSSEASTSASLYTPYSIQNTDNLTPPDSLLATSSATLANLTVLSEATISGRLLAYEAAVSNIFKSLGETFLGNTTVAGDLSVDGTLSLTGNSINSIGSCNYSSSEARSSLPVESGSNNSCGTLYIQNSPLTKKVDFFNGKVVIDSQGQVVAQKLIITGTKVLGATTDPTIGSGTITVGQIGVIVENNQVSSTSKIFLTPRSKIGNQSLAVESTVPGQSFKVSLDHAVNNDIIFDWWIIETKNSE